jgi:glycosyltransferase involved in cell wall biosynthesis
MSRGHDVTWLFTAEEAGATVLEPEGLTAVYVRRGPPRGRGRFRLDPVVRAGPPLARLLRRHSFDVVEAHHPIDGAMVRLATRTPYVQWLPGAPSAQSIAGRPLHRWAARTALAGAFEVHCLSKFAAMQLHRELDIRARVATPGVDTGRYGGARRPCVDPMILCTAAADDPRKRLGLLLRAFTSVRRAEPAARLVLAPPRAESLIRRIDALPEGERRGVSVQPDLTLDQLDDLYRTAWVCALPSVEEAFGLVLVEGLAAGAVAVGTRHGAIPEVITDDSIGVLHDPDDPEDLARALVSGIALAREPGTAARCRAHARRWDWGERGPAIEDALMRGAR